MKILFTLLFLVGSFTVFSQQLIVSGIVTGDALPLPGVEITIEGKKDRSTLTDFDGKYEIQVATGETLVFTFVGFFTQKIKVGTNPTINIDLKIEQNSLDEVVVVGYQKQRKREFSCSGVPAIKAEDLKNIAVPNVEEALQGQVSGALVTQGSRIPGAKINVQIRGANTLSNGNYPSNIYGYSAPSAIIAKEKISTNESYARVEENGFKHPTQTPLSTFSIDVDAASYSNMRRFLMNGNQPPADAVRIEEMINYFNYDYPQPKDEHPFSIYQELATCPWNKDHYLLHLGIQGKNIDLEEAPANNLVFLIDVSGSMDSHNKLPLLKKAFTLLVNQMRKKDRIAIVVYAGNSGLALKSTSGNNKEKIIAALDNLAAGGSTAGGKGLKLAYKVAKENFIKNGNNRIILATDGDFNVGASSDLAMENLIKAHRDQDIFISVTGFGMGNYKDSKMETIADKGNGNYAYIDNLLEAQKVFVQEFGGTLHTIAKDVKIQVEFNPNHVESYRLIGYENRKLNAEDFADDKKDAGELGAGHTVTALYEIVPKKETTSGSQPLKYQKTKSSSELNNEIATVKFRYKQPKGKKSTLISQPIYNSIVTEDATSENFRFSSAVASFGMQLRNSEYKGDFSFKDIKLLAKVSKSNDEFGYRAEFVRLIDLAERLR